MTQAMANTRTNPQSVERTILLSARLYELTAPLREHAFKVMTWPALAIQAPPTFFGLDEAIENLFGYDWLIFINVDAVRFFRERLNTQGHDVSELDSLRVCAIGDATGRALEESRVHVDVIVTDVTATRTVADIGNYAGGREFLQRLNFLIPQAAIGRDYLRQQLEDAGARADSVVAYQTVAANDATRLSVLQSLLLTGSVDAVAFGDETDVCEFARLFDTSDLGQLLRNSIVLSSGRNATTTAEQMGIASSVIAQSSSPSEMIEALLNGFA
jgi:uroporphyrinogen III methyltransferase / synthase